MACLGLLPLAVSCSSQKPPEAGQMTTEAAQACVRGLYHAKDSEYDLAIARLHRGHPPRPQICKRLQQPGLCHAKKSDHDQAHRRLQ